LEYQSTFAKPTRIVTKRAQAVLKVRAAGTPVSGTGIDRAMTEFMDGKPTI
jgi:hypothetical protein